MAVKKKKGLGRGLDALISPNNITDNTFRDNCT